jgi:protein required for attachment to host cells
MQKEILWALVANSSSAFIYEIVGRGKEIRDIQSFDHPEGREKSGAILSDRPGRTFDKVGVGRHAVGTKVDVRSHEQKIFAHEIAEMLFKALSENRFHKLAIISPPQFLGEIKHALHDNVKKVIANEIDKEISTDATPQTRKHQMARFLDLRIE